MTMVRRGFTTAVSAIPFHGSSLQTASRWLPCMTTLRESSSHQLPASIRRIILPGRDSAPERSQSCSLLLATAAGIDCMGHCRCLAVFQSRPWPLAMRPTQAYLLSGYLPPASQSCSKECSSTRYNYLCCGAAKSCLISDW